MKTHISKLSWNVLLIRTYSEFCSLVTGYFIQLEKINGCHSCIIRLQTSFIRVCTKKHIVNDSHLMSQQSIILKRFTDTICSHRKMWQRLSTKWMTMVAKWLQKLCTTPWWVCTIAMTLSPKYMKYFNCPCTINKFKISRMKILIFFFSLLQKHKKGIS